MSAFLFSPDMFSLSYLQVHNQFVFLEQIILNLGKKLSEVFF